MDLQTLLLAMSIPSGVTAFCFWLVEEKMKRERREQEEKEKVRQKSEVLILSILVDTFISKISFPMQPGPEIGSISDA